MYSEVLSAPNVGDGNVVAKLALRLLAERAGIAIAGDYEMPYTSWFAAAFHARMTKDPQRAAAYVEGSEATRTGVLGRLFASLSFRELVHGIVADGVPRPVRWFATQEHALLGATSHLLSKAGIERINLMVPDVHPKASAVLAARRFPCATIGVWNTAAYEELSAAGSRVALVRPWILDGMRPDSTTFMTEGTPVVVKTSGSGLPAEWRARLLDVLPTLDQGWAFHTPQGRISGSSDRRDGQAPNKVSRLHSLYADLGGQTQVLVGYPSELTKVVCELRSRAIPTWMITFPPRGSHERRNLDFAIEHDLVAAQLQFGDAPAPWSPLNAGPYIRPEELPRVIAALSPAPVLPPGVLGCVSPWEAPELLLH